MERAVNMVPIEWKWVLGVMGSVKVWEGSKSRVASPVVGKCF